MAAISKDEEKRRLLTRLILQKLQQDWPTQRSVEKNVLGIKSPTKPSSDVRELVESFINAFTKTQRYQEERFLELTNTTGWPVEVRKKAANTFNGFVQEQIRQSPREVIAYAFTGVDFTKLTGSAKKAYTHTQVLTKFSPDTQKHYHVLVGERLLVSEVIDTTKFNQRCAMALVRGDNPSEQVLETMASLWQPESREGRERILDWAYSVAKKVHFDS